MDNLKWDYLHASMAMIRMRQEMFGNSGGFGFNVSFVDRASMLVESVFETSLSFAMYCKWQRLHCIMYIKFLVLQVMCDLI